MQPLVLNVGHHAARHGGHGAAGGVDVDEERREDECHGQVHVGEQAFDDDADRLGGPAMGGAEDDGDHAGQSHGDFSGLEQFAADYECGDHSHSDDDYVHYRIGQKIPLPFGFQAGAPEKPGPGSESLLSLSRP